ncbi:MAG: redox-sensing transcriptional repressor Rex [Mycobacteriaceae bacterium]
MTEQPLDGQGPQLPGSVGAEQRVIPDAAVARLAIYLRVLSVFQESGALMVSSEELSRAAGVGSAKLRKDLSFLGPSGVRGVGYDVARLMVRIETALGLDRDHNVVVVGVGSLGRALARYGGFGRRGFSVVGLFDSDPRLIGDRIAELPVRDIDDLFLACATLDVSIGVIATPAAVAQEVCDLLVRAGVGCILNFASTALEVPVQVEMRRVDLALEMQVLSFHSARKLSLVGNGSVSAQ